MPCRQAAWQAPRRLLLVFLTEGRDQAIDAVLVDLLCELVAIILNKPDAFDVEVVDLPAFRGFFEAVIDGHGWCVVL